MIGIKFQHSKQLYKTCAVLASAVLAAALCIPQASAGEKGHPSARAAEVLVRLPRTPVSFPPPASFLASINAAAVAVRENGAKHVTLIGGDRTADRFARIILQSHEIPLSSLTSTASLKSAFMLSWAAAVRAAPKDNGATIGITGPFTEEELGELESLPIELAKLPIEFARLPAIPPPSPLRTPRKRTIALVIPGNEPLDDSTPTIDMSRRVLRAVDIVRKRPVSLLVFSGGATGDTMSEAKMMALIALSRGVPLERMVLEERARSTGENALYAGRILKQRGIERAVIVSKKEHLDWAMPIFRKYEPFERAVRLESRVSREEIIAQMKDYLKLHDSKRVRQRLDQLLKGISGTD